MKQIFRLFFQVVFLPFVQFHYRVQRIGLDNVPKEGGVLLVSNHVSYIDSFVIYLCSPRPVRFVVLEHYVKVKSIGWFLKLFGAIPIRQGSARDAIAKSVEALKNGDVVCLFPEGELTRTGVLGPIHKGYELIARKAECPVVPVYMNGLFRSIFSYERSRYFKKTPNGFFCPIEVAFGKPIPGPEAVEERLREALLEASVAAFSHRRGLNRPLEIQVIKALKKRRRNSFLVEKGKGEPREWSRAYFLGLAVAVARKWMMSPPEEGNRIGILLPPGPMPAAINLGLFLAGKTPVNLPFTMNQREMESLAKSIAPLGLRTVITSKAFIPHLVDFWQGDEGVFIDLKSVVSAPGAAMMWLERLRAMIEPAWITAWRLELKTRNPDREAVGMVARPGDEAVLLSARELHKNALQVSAAHFVEPDDVIFSEISLSRAAGLVLGFWAPMMAKGKLVCRSFSMREDSSLLAELALHEGVTIISGTARFFRQIREPLGIKALKYGVIFDEVNPFELADYEEAIDLPLARAWDYLGRVVTLSRTDPNENLASNHAPQKGRAPKSVGRFLPGIGASLQDGLLSIRFTPEQEWKEAATGAEFDEFGLMYIRDERARLAK